MNLRVVKHAARAAAIAILCVVASQCMTGRIESPPLPRYQSNLPPSPLSWSGERYSRIEENPFVSASAKPLSTFSVDVDRASYSNVRRFLLQGHVPPRDAVRIEELVNYFPYEYAEPDDDAAIAIDAEVGVAPWHPAHRLVRIGLQAKRISTQDLPASNLVFLIDVSGSMQDEDKLPLVKSAFALLVEQLRAEDRVAIVVYAGQAGLALRSTSGARKERILNAIGSLRAAGGTAGGAGLRRAYDEAAEHFIPGGNNRVILATDGDFNVGESSDAAMVRLIEEQRQGGVFLTVLGVGQGNLQDAKMEKLADHGNGNYAYLDNLLEAQKVLVYELGGTLFTVAKDVKVQVEFNPERVRAYRLIGYENRLLRNRDFVDDRKDAGDMGSGHSVTALYEVVLAGEDSDLIGVEPLRYQEPPRIEEPAPGPELLYVKVRYKEPDGEAIRTISEAVTDVAAEPSTDFRFQAAVAEFGLLLRASKHRATADWSHVVGAARQSLGRDPDGYRAEFARLADAARSVTIARADNR